MDVSARGSLVWEKDTVHKENLQVLASDHHTLSHTNIVDHGDHTRVAEVKRQCIKILFLYCTERSFALSITLLCTTRFPNELHPVTKRVIKRKRYFILP